MKLKAAAKFFDQLALHDAYSLLPAFKGQLDVFDDSRRDAYGVERRILSTAPDVAIPPRFALLEPIRNEVWLVGTCQPDYYRSEVIRNKYVLHRADGQAHLRTPAQLLADTEGVRAYANAAWIKDAKQQEEANTAPGMYSVFLARAEPVLNNSVIQVEGLTLWVRGRYESSADFTVAESEDITGSLQTVTYSTHTYNAVLDAKTENTLTTPALVLRWQTPYENTSEASLKIEHGDRVVVLRKDAVAAPKAGDKVRSTLTWEVRGVEDRGDVWALQVRVV